MATTKSKLGEMLVKENLITEAQLQKAAEFQQQVGGNLGTILVKLGSITDEKLTGFIARKQGLEIADLDKMILPDNLIRRIPRALIEKEMVVPIAFADGVITIASADPTDLEAVEKIQFATSLKVELQLSSRGAIQRAIQRAFQQGEAPKVGKAKTKEELLRELTAAPEAKSSGRNLADDPELVRALMPLLLEKGLVTEDELRRKARELAR